ncbi:MAG: hypothetical protein OEU90_03595 [Gammaproteobacteria bacterium]|nr:hypothetical protein [Gammaproteobacteria bacterium]MDH3750000.1 hypothetical protein [Gammaproteobacteria bacterium]MDH3804538.1 hypothetical protein [Gammaproteobacteria bacterium]
MNLLSRVVSAATALALAAAVLPSAAQDVESVAAAAQPEPITFPRTLTSDAGTVVMHTPQIDSWNDYAKLEGRIAVEVTPAGEDDAAYGVAEFTADTDPNLELRVVAIENTAITVTSFPVPDDARREQLDAVVRSTAQHRTHYVPLDVILTYIAPNASMPEEEGLSFEPPPIFYSGTPALLVMTDGEPLLAPLPDTKLQYVVNTNWDLFRYKDKEWYLRNDDRWLKNKELSGEWDYDSRLPGDFKKLPDDGNWVEVKSANPPAKGDSTEPTVFVSNRPAELILIEGQPDYRTTNNASLQYISNTESDVFRYQAKFYYLVSGRWFRAAQLRGPWEHVQELPEIFASIDPDGEKGHVLAAVANTDEARMAVLEASIPRKATVSRDAGDKVNVFFQGEPVFEEISGTSVQRAVNSSNDILKVGEEYYLCDNAVWYVAMSTDGPWLVADAIPAAIYSIPPSSPSYHVTHVHIYESDDDTVSTGYTSGYFGVTVAFGVAMYGSGWYYPPYYGHYPYYGYPYYPIYYPYPYSYGASAWYNPNTGMYGRSASVYGPYGGYGRAASYNPQTGTYARGEAVWDNNEIAGRGVAYNPRTGTGIATNRYANDKGGWGESLITHNDKWVATQSEWGKNWSTTEFETSEGGSGTIERQREGDTVYGSGEFERGDESLSTRSARNEQGGIVVGETGSGERGMIGRTDEGDLYAGKDGSVYRRDEDGWHENTGGGWNPVEVPDERAAQMDQARDSFSTKRDSASQSLSADRTTRSQAQSTLSSSGFADSYGSARSADSWSNRTYDSTRNRSSYDGSRRSELDRSYNARSSGYERYNNRSSAGAGSFNRSAGSRPAGRRRR